MQLVSMIAEKEDESVFVKAVPLECGNDLADLIIGKKQAVVVVGDLLSDFGDVR